MKYPLFILLFFVFGCSAEVEYMEPQQIEIPIGIMSQKENAMVVYTNEYREALGLQKYKTSLDLYYFAKGRVYDMAEAHTLSHNGWDIPRQQSGAIYYGESISNNLITAESNIQAFRNSNDHWPMFISPIYEYIAIACEGNYTCVLVARWRIYNGKKALEIREVINGNVSTITIQ